MFKKILTSCKAYGSSVKLVSNAVINKCFTGQLLSMCVNLSLNVQRELLRESFTPDTPYLLSRYLSTEDEDNETGGLCLLFSTFNLALNYVRVSHWYNVNVTLAFDHAFKMHIKYRPHFTVNVMVPIHPAPCPYTLLLVNVHPANLLCRVLQICDFVLQHIHQVLCS